jgi:hypothetical protein
LRSRPRTINNNLVVVDRRPHRARVVITRGHDCERVHRARSFIGVVSHRGYSSASASDEIFNDKKLTQRDKHRRARAGEREGEREADGASERRR